MTRLYKTALGVLILAPLCLWAISNWWQAGHEVMRYYIDLPVWDYFNTIQHYPRYKAGDLSVFWLQHNEHRIVASEAVIAADLLWFHGQILLPTVLSFALYLGIWLVMVWAILKDRSLDLLPGFAAIFIAAILFAWKGCAAALGSPFLLQWTINLFAAILAIAFLAKCFVARRNSWLVPLIACGVVCTFSSANGLALWPLLVAMAMCLRLGWRQVLAITLAGCATCALFFAGYQRMATLNWQAVVSHPLYTLKFISSFLSMPFAVLREGPDFGLRIGGIGLLALVLLALCAWRTRLLTTVTGIVLFGYAAFIFCVAFMVALGRMNPSDPYLVDPKAIRYLLLPLSYWGNVAFVAIWVLGHIRFRGSVLATAVAVALSLLLYRMAHKPAFAVFSHAVDAGYANQQWAALAVESGLLDPVTNLILFPDPQVVGSVKPLMIAEKLCLFSRPEAYWVGSNLKSVFPGVLHPAMPGGVVTSQRLATGVALAGWTNETSSLFHRLELVLVDENNRIVGLGERLPAGLPERFTKLGISPAKQWSGFVNLAYGSHSITPLVVTADRKAVIPLTAEFKISGVNER